MLIFHPAGHYSKKSPAEYSYRSVSYARRLVSGQNIVELAIPGPQTRRGTLIGMRPRLAKIAALTSVIGATNANLVASVRPLAKSDVALLVAAAATVLSVVILTHKIILIIF